MVWHKTRACLEWLRARGQGTKIVLLECSVKLGIETKAMYETLWSHTSDILWIETVSALFSAITTRTKVSGDQRWPWITFTAVHCPDLVTDGSLQLCKTS